MTEHGMLILLYLLLAMNVVWIYVVYHLLDEIKLIRDKVIMVEKRADNLHDTVYGFFRPIAREEQ